MPSLPEEYHETIIVGGGQAGLVMSWHLARRGRPHLVIERARIAERWRSERWESLAFQMPNWSLELPDMPYVGNDPDGFATSAEILAFLERFVAINRPPIRTGVEVTGLCADDASGGLIVATTAGDLGARNVVIATGPFHKVRRPDLAQTLPAQLLQLDANEYHAPGQLPEGAVLVVGSGSSGTQIAEELARAGRRVFLSVGGHRYTPRRYRGRDVIWWFEKLGRFDIPVDTFPDRKYPPPTVMTGAEGGHDLCARMLAAEGVVLLGRVEALLGSVLQLGDDLDRVLGDADAACADFIRQADALGDRLGLPPDTWPPPGLTDGVVPSIRELDLAAAEVSSVIWATGYRPDYAWIRLPLFLPDGTPRQDRGVTAHPGVCFLGLHWMHTFRSGLLSFVGRDAAYLADWMERSGRLA